MAGTHEGAKKAVETTKERYGEDFYEEIGERGGESQGKEKNPGNFANDRKKAKEAGKVGGSHSHGGGRNR